MLKATDESRIVDDVIDTVGFDIRMAIPLGLGKPNQLVNAFYARAKQDSRVSLKIYTALTLAKPAGKSLLEKRFLQPFADRVFADFVDPDYEIDQQKNRLPKNVEVFEFYFPAGKKRNLRKAQENYICSNYTHVARDLIDRRVNVIAQLVARSPDEKTFSLSCNPDVAPDIAEHFKTSGAVFAQIAQVNDQLPFMYGDAVVPVDEFTHVLDNPKYHTALFAPPKMSVNTCEYAIGYYASTLVKDGGELQVGIGSLGDALVHALILRHTDNREYLKIVEHLGAKTKFADIIEQKGDLSVFSEGLFAASEMFVDGFKYLFDKGIISRKVYDDIFIQRLLNEGLVNEKVTEITLYELIRRGAVSAEITQKDFIYLQKYGVFRSDLTFTDGFLFDSSGEKTSANLNQEKSMLWVKEKALGDELKNGAVIHGGFFLGCHEFYSWLREMPKEQRRLIHMKPVTKINQLYGHEELDRLHRKDARFINTCLKMTLSGAAVSDGLEDGQVISGVGGQYNFVAMAQALPDGYSIIQLRSTRLEEGEVQSNIVFNYGHVTIPRHLRDIVITEYGIADLRGKTDSEIAASLIEIADSRFQQELIAQCKQAGKLDAEYQVPRHAQNNLPEILERIFAQFEPSVYFPKFPFGTDFTDEEVQLGRALKSLKRKSAQPVRLIAALLKGLTKSPDAEELNLLKRMKLDRPKGLKEFVYSKILLSELS